MFRTRKSFISPRRGQTWLFKIENISDAEIAIKICYQILYVLATVQAVTISIFYVYDSRYDLSSFIDPLIILCLAWFIEHKKSRTAAAILAIYAVMPVAIATIEIVFRNQPGVNLRSSFDHTNIMMTIAKMFASYKGVKGTYRYHHLSHHIVNFGNIWKMAGLCTIYNILVFVIFIFIAVLSHLAQRIWGSTASVLSDDTLGGALIIGMLLASAGTAFRILPWTKNKPLISNENIGPEEKLSL